MNRSVRRGQGEGRREGGREGGSDGRTDGEKEGGREKGGWETETEGIFIHESITDVTRHRRLGGFVHVCQERALLDKHSSNISKAIEDVE